MAIENKQSIRTLEKLSDGIRVVKALVRTAHSTPDLLLSRARTMQSLSKAINSFDAVLSNKSDRSLLSIRKESKVLHNTLVSLNHGLEHNELDVDYFLDELKTTCSERVEALELLSEAINNLDEIDAGVDLDGTLLGTSASNEIELGDLSERKAQVNKSDYTKTITRLNRYDKSKSKLAATIRPTAVVPVSLPIAVMFESGKLRNSTVLESIFTGNVDLIGVNGPRSQDVGLVLRDQVILQFSKSYALERASEETEDSGTASELKRTAAVIKNLKIALKKAMAEYNEKLIEFESYVSPKAKNAFDTVRNKKHKLLLEQELDQYKLKVSQVKEKLTHHDERAKTAKSVHKASTKVKLTSTNVFFSHITEFLDSMRENGKNYTLVSSEFIPSITNRDIMTCWVVETSVYNRMVGLAGNARVLRWGFAWTSSTKQRTLHMPSSMKSVIKAR